jgi:dimethylsulfone monooxygenase
MHSGNKLKLGLFGANCSSGKNATLVPERWQATWADNVRLATMADECGIEFMLPIGRWKGYGGITDYEGSTFETLTWATGLLAKTKQLTVFGTVHAPLFHPVIAAKQIVTADHVGQGRFALNIVCGWNEGEFEMFGVEQRGHEDRYEQGDEWLRALRMLWSEADDFDFDGTYYHFKGVRAKPKPYGGTNPLIMNAGASPAGHDFAIRNCDAYFTGVRQSGFDEKTGIIVPAFEQAAAKVAEVRAEAARLGREIGVFTRADIFCRPSQKEAYDYYHYAVVENADWGAVEGQLRLFGVTRENTPDFDERCRQHVRGFPIIGDPDRVAAVVGELSGAGFDGLAFSCLNYTDELPFVRDEVLPRLEAAGIRGPGLAAARSV